MKNWKAILGVLAVFLLGVTAGGLATHGFYQKRIRAYQRGQATATPEAIARQMGAQLKLTPEQRDQIAAIIGDTRQRLQQARAQSEPQVRDAFQDMTRRVRDTLTPEQRQQFDRLTSERRERWKKVFPRIAPASSP
jgi:Spy/CpxP family protein refolding chaperone